MHLSNDMFSCKGIAAVFALLSLVLAALLSREYEKFRNDENEIASLSTFVSSNERIVLHDNEMQTSYIVEQLRYVQNIKRGFKNPGLDLIWNDVKHDTVSNLVDVLIRRTGDNFGDNVDAWSRKFGVDATNALSPTVQNKK